MGDHQSYRYFIRLRDCKFKQPFSKGHRNKFLFIMRKLNTRNRLGVHVYMDFFNTHQYQLYFEAPSFLSAIHHKPLEKAGINYLYAKAKK